MQIIGIIPTRYASTRFEGKPLCDIAGKTMVQRVYENAKRANLLSEVWIATDDTRIFDHVQQFGGKVVMTSSNHQSGTDRCAEAIKINQSQANVVINIQGDEPLIHPEQIDELAELFTNPQIQIGTLVKKITSASDLFDPNLPKVIINKQNQALYFSRQTIPFLRDVSPDKWFDLHSFYSHVGMYGFRTSVLKSLVQLPPSSLELAEKLEQLRWLENGYTIYTHLTNYKNIAIDTPEDLEKVLRLMETNNTRHD